MQQLDARRMMEAAERETGLSDWGGTDFIEPFTILIESLNDEAQLSEAGLERTRSHLDNLLVYRLRLFEDRKRRPEIAAQRIEQPIFMMGMPRAGTSFLNSLMSCDPANLSPQTWQMWCPSPPPNDPTIDHRSQIERATRLMDEQGFTAPNLRNKHEYAALNAEEDGHMWEFQFLATNFPAFWNIPTYAAYLYSHPYAPAYRMHQCVLQTLQVGAEGRRWTLKAPGHTWHLEALLEVYPDARFVMHHRDPSRVLASVLSLLMEHWAQFSDQPLQTNQEFVNAFTQNMVGALDNVMRLRRENPELNRRFVDIAYLELERDSLATVGRIYRELGMTLSDTARLAMQDWHAGNRKGKHGGHAYALADYGLNQQEIHAQFRGYIEHFKVELEMGA